MNDILECPFCSKAAPTSSENGTYYLFKCPNCGMFLIYDGTFRRLNRGECAANRPALLGFVKSTPADKIAYIGHRFNHDDPPKYELYTEYRPLNGK